MQTGGGRPQHGNPSAAAVRRELDGPDNGCGYWRGRTTVAACHAGLAPGVHRLQLGGGARLEHAQGLRRVLVDDFFQFAFKHNLSIVFETDKKIQIINWHGSGCAQPIACICPFVSVRQVAELIDLDGRAYELRLVSKFKW